MAEALYFAPPSRQQQHSAPTPPSCDPLDWPDCDDVTLAARQASQSHFHQEVCSRLRDWLDQRPSVFPTSSGSDCHTRKRKRLPDNAADDTADDIVTKLLHDLDHIAHKRHRTNSLQVRDDTASASSNRSPEVEEAARSAHESDRITESPSRGYASPERGDGEDSKPILRTWKRTRERSRLERGVSITTSSRKYPLSRQSKKRRPPGGAEQENLHIGQSTRRKDILRSSPKAEALWIKGMFLGTEHDIDFTATKPDKLKSHAFEFRQAELCEPSCTAEASFFWDARTASNSLDWSWWPMLVPDVNPRLSPRPLVL